MCIRDSSYNVPAVYLFNQIGIQKGISYGQKFGLNFDNVPEELGISLGGGVTASPLPVSYTHLDVYKRQVSHVTNNK